MMNMFIILLSLTVEKINASNFKIKLVTKFLKVVNSFLMIIEKIDVNSFKMKFAFKFFKAAEKQKIQKKRILKIMLNTSCRKDN